MGGDRRRQHAGGGGEAAVEPQLAQRQVTGERVGRDGADGGHQCQRDGQVVMAALLGQVGGGEIDGDAPRRQAEARSGQRGPHPLTGFLHRLVGQADNQELGNTRCDLHLHVDGDRLDALKRDGLHPRYHAPAPEACAASAGKG
jgi:hypothetical protein